MVLKIVRAGIYAAALCVSLGAASFADDKGKTPAEDPEVKLGRENAAENDKEVKLITEPAIVERVNRIGQEIAAVANTLEIPAHWGSSELKKFNYTFKVVDDKDVNAYSLPGGFIYVHKGLLDYVRSDDELAGVLAHEVAHASHHHMKKLLHEQSKMQVPVLAAILAGTALSKGTGSDSATKLALAGQLYMTAKLNSYGIEAEKDADQTGVRYLTKTKYNPVGLLTFMERLALDEQQRPDRQLGIFQTHPASPDRAKSAIHELGNLKVPINRSVVDPTRRAIMHMVTVNGSPAAEVKMFKTVVARMVAANDTPAEERGKALADTLNRLFDQGVQMFDLRLSADKSKVFLRNQTVVVITADDAAAQKTTVAQLGQSAYEALRALLWQDQFSRPIGGSP
jgi:beta-barrel assembly-enhancing protease